MSTLGYIYIFLKAGINFKAAILKLRQKKTRCCMRSNWDEIRDTGSSYANEWNKCQNGGEELMRTESACLGLRGKCMTERTSDVHFQRKVSRHYHGSHCDLQINFNAPLWRFCVTLPLSFLFLYFILFFWVPIAFSTPRLAAMTSEQTHVDPEKPGAHGKERWGGKVSIKDSSQMSLIHYCIVKEML